jgi:exopolysaccharide biosynthesis polyprenyl glycosylphosphotransferase
MANSKSGNKTAAVRLRTTERRIILLIGDALMSGAALILALYLWAAKDEWLKFSSRFLEERPPFWFWLMPLVWLLLMIELYDVRRAGRLSDTLRGLLISGIIGFGLYLVIFFFSVADSLPRLGVAYFIIGSILLTLLWRMLYIRVFTSPRFMRRVLIVGAGRQGSEMARMVRSMTPPPFFLAGLVDDDPAKQGQLVENFPVLGDGGRLKQLVEEHQITDLIFAISGEVSPELFRSLLNVQESGVELTTMPAVYEELLGRVPIFLLQSDWILRSFVEQRTVGDFYEEFKRLLDIAGGIVGTLIFLMLTPLISLLILLEGLGPVFFTQGRLGRSGQMYTIVKFRSMRPLLPSEKPRATLMDDERITRVGRLLRKSHMDELPQFLNVLRGEMSLVGPRAEQADLVDQFQNQIPFYRARLLVKPGLTGWAQVNYGYAATVEETANKLEYDLYYIKHRNLTLDIVILLRTISNVIGLKGQ